MQIVIQLKREAIQEAKKNRDGIVLWTDGSRLDFGKVGAAVVWFDKWLDKWQEKRRFLGEHKDSFDAELWSISDALVLGTKKTRNTGPTTVTVFTNSQAAISKIFDSKTKVGRDAVRNLVYQSAQE